eukprot:2982398-Amphidinium_carterae.1
MLLDVMRKKLPSDSFVKLSLVDGIESKLKEPSNIADCSKTLRTYLQDLRIADGMLASLGSTGTRIQLNTIKVFQVLRTFVSHVCKLDTTLSTKIVLLGDVTENMSIDQLTGWALRVLGVIAEHVQQDKNMKQMFGSSAGPSNLKNTKGPQANAATPDPKGQGKGKSKDNKGSIRARVQDSHRSPTSRVSLRARVQKIRFLSHGSACVFFHPRVGRQEGKCYNCGTKKHDIKECTRARPTPQQLQKRGNGRGSNAPPVMNPKAAPNAPPNTGKRGGKKGSKGAKAKAKASAANAEVEPPAEGARFCIRLKPKMKELIAER